MVSEARNGLPGVAGVVAGLRYYSPGMGRWTSRDPIGERGGNNQHAFCANAAVDAADAFGELAISGAWSWWSWWPWGPKKPPLPKPELPKTKDWASAAIKCGMANFFSLIGTKLSDYAKAHYACKNIGLHCAKFAVKAPENGFFYPEGGVSLVGDSSLTECMVKELVNGILPPGAPNLKYDPPDVTLYARVGLQYTCTPGGLVWGLRKAVRVEIDGEDSGRTVENKWAAAGYCGKSGVGNYAAYCYCCEPK